MQCLFFRTQFKIRYEKNIKMDLPSDYTFHVTLCLTFSESCEGN